MKKPVPIGPEEVKYSGRIIEVIQQPHKIGDKIINFEMARRSPGVRLLIVKDRKILLLKEYRTELKDYDYRLPGGKVFDSLEEYRDSDKEKLLEAAAKAAKREAKEETGIVVRDAEHI